MEEEISANQTRPLNSEYTSYTVRDVEALRDEYGDSNAAHSTVSVSQAPQEHEEQQQDGNDALADNDDDGATKKKLARRRRAWIIGSVSVLVVILIVTGVEAARLSSLKNDAANMVHSPQLFVDLSQYDAAISVNATLNSDTMPTNMHGVDVGRVECSLKDAQGTSLGAVIVDAVGTIVEAWYGTNKGRRLTDIASAYKASDEELAHVNNLFFGLFDDSDSEGVAAHSHALLSNATVACSVSGTVRLWGFLPIPWHKDVSRERAFAEALQTWMFDREAVRRRRRHNHTEGESYFEQFVNFLRHPGVTFERYNVNVEALLPQLVRYATSVALDGTSGNQVPDLDVLQHVRVLKTLPRVATTAADVRVRIPHVEYAVSGEYARDEVGPEEWHGRHWRLAVHDSVYDATRNDSALNVSLACQSDSGRPCCLMSPLTEMRAALDANVHEGVVVNVRTHADNFLARFLKRTFTARLTRTPDNDCTHYTLDDVRYWARSCGVWSGSVLAGRLSVLTRNSSEVFYAGYAQSVKNGGDEEQGTSGTSVNALAEIGSHNAWRLTVPFNLSTQARTASLQVAYETLEANTVTHTNAQEQFSAGAYVAWDNASAGGATGGDVAVYVYDDVSARNYSFGGAFQVDGNAQTFAVSGSAQETLAHAFLFNASVASAWGSQVQNSFFENVRATFTYNETQYLFQQFFVQSASPSENRFSAQLKTSGQSKSPYNSQYIWVQNLQVFAQLPQNGTQQESTTFVNVQPSLQAPGFFQYQGNFDVTVDTQSNTLGVEYNSFGQPQALVQDGQLDAQWSYTGSTSSSGSTASDITFGATSTLSVAGAPFWDVDSRFSAQYNSTAGVTARLTVAESVHALDSAQDVRVSWNSDGISGINATSAIDTLVRATAALNATALYNASALFTFQNAQEQVNYQEPVLNGTEQIGYVYTQSQSTNNTVSVVVREAVSQYVQTTDYASAYENFNNFTCLYGQPYCSTNYVFAQYQQNVSGSANLGERTLGTFSQNFAQLNTNNTLYTGTVQYAQSVSDDSYGMTMRNDYALDFSVPNETAFQNSVTSTYYTPNVTKDPLFDDAFRLLIIAPSENFTVYVRNTAKASYNILSEAFSTTQVSQYKGTVPGEKSTLSVDFTLTDYDNINQQATQQRFDLKDNFVLQTVSSGGAEYASGDVNYTAVNDIAFSYRTQPKYTSRTTFSQGVYAPPNNNGGAVQTLFTYKDKNATTGEARINANTLTTYRVNTSDAQNAIRVNLTVDAFAQNLETGNNYFNYTLEQGYYQPQNNAFQFDIQVTDNYDTNTDGQQQQQQQQQQQTGTYGATVAVQLQNRVTRTHDEVAAVIGTTAAQPADAYNYTNSSVSTYFYATRVGIVSVDVYYLQDSLNPAWAAGASLYTYNSTANARDHNVTTAVAAATPSIAFGIVGGVQEQDAWQQVQGGGHIYTATANTQYVVAPVSFTYNATTQVATFSVRNTAPSYEFLCQSNGVQYKRGANDSYALSGTVLYQVRAQAASNVYAYVNYSRGAQSVQYYVTDSASGLIANAYAYWRTNGYLPGGQAIVFEFNVPVFTIATTARSYADALGFVGVFTGAPNSFFLLNLTNVYQGSAGQGVLQNLYVSDAWNTQGDADQNSTLIWNVLQSALVWDNTQVYAYEQNYDIFVQGTTDTEGNLFVFEANTQLWVQNASRLVYNTSIIAQASTDNEQAMLVIENADWTLSQSASPIENFYLDAEVQWPGVGRAQSWSISAKAEAVARQNEIFYTTLNVKRDSSGDGGAVACDLEWVSV